MTKHMTDAETLATQVASGNVIVGLLRRKLVSMPEDTQQVAGRAVSWSVFSFEDNVCPVAQTWFGVLH
jgi:hypothetical protein